LVFDTSGLSRFLDEEEPITATVIDPSWTKRLIPLSADAELRFGFKYGNRERQNQEKYDKAREFFSLRITMPDQQTAILYAELATWCRQHGKSLSDNDLWIAATAVQHGGQLLTTDKDFAALPQVRLANLSAI